jgi:hypothetical protein
MKQKTIFTIAVSFLISTMFVTPICACEHGACPWGDAQCQHLEGRFQEGEKFFDKMPYCDENNCCQYIVCEVIICESGYEIGHRNCGEGFNLLRARECTDPGEFKGEWKRIQVCTDDGCWKTVKTCGDDEQLSFDSYNTQYNGWVCEKKTSTPGFEVIFAIVGFILVCIWSLNFVKS